MSGDGPRIIVLPRMHISTYRGTVVHVRDFEKNYSSD